MTPPSASAPAAVLPGFARRFWPVFALGLIGIAALPLKLRGLGTDLPLPPEMADWPPGLALALSLLNPLLMLVVTSVLGAFVAHRVGLGSVLAGTWPRWHPGRAVIEPLLVGLALAAVVHGLDVLWAPLLGGAWRVLREASQAAGGSDLLVGLLYGGLTEEVLLRWGVMSLLAWAMLAFWRRLPGKTESAPPALMGVAIAVSALLFALGHLPALAATVELTPTIVARTLALNLLAGLVYGWQYWRHGLEAAMLAHMATHLGFFAVALRA